MHKETVVQTFGARYKDPHSVKADRVYDIRGLDASDKGVLDRKAHEIMDKLSPGDHIAVFCEFGHDRSVHIAEKIKREYPGVVVEHLTYDEAEKDPAHPKEFKENPHAVTQGQKPGRRQ